MLLPHPGPSPPAPGVGRPLPECTLPECARDCRGWVLRPLAVPLGLYRAASLDSRAPGRPEWRVGLVKQKDRSLSRKPLSLWSTIPCLLPGGVRLRQGYLSSKLHAPGLD